jgi:conjugal transfer mating pair stabilization protein TraN
MTTRLLLIALLALAGTACGDFALAQTTTEAARRDGKAFGAEKSAEAQADAMTEPDATRLPNYDATPEQSAYFDDPDRMAGAFAITAQSHEGYQSIRTSDRERARFNTGQLKETIARAKAVSAEPNQYASGMAGTNGGCVPLPASSSSPGRYTATCNTGYSVSQSVQSCSVTLDAAVTTRTDYLYLCNAAPTHELNQVDDCALFPGGQCRHTGTRPGVCLEYELLPRGRRVCIDRADPIEEITCTSPVIGAKLISQTPVTTVSTTINDSQCARLAADSQCTAPVDTCTDSDPVTRMIDGQPVTAPCWAWRRDYQCNNLQAAQDCTSLEANPGCRLVREDCLTEDSPCLTAERVYDCALPASPSGEQQYICDGDIYCINGECETITREPNTEFKDAVVALNAVKQARGEFDPDTLSLFKGERGTCSSKVFGILNCCKGKGFPLIPGIGLLVALGCDASEVLLHQRDAQGLCTYVGTYCSNKVLGVCVTKRKAHCCYESKLTRIIQEQGRAQLGKVWASPKTEQCAGFTLDEFSRLDLSQMDFSEVYAEFTDAVRVPEELAILTDIQQKIEDFYAQHAN